MMFVHVVTRVRLPGLAGVGGSVDGGSEGTDVSNMSPVVSENRGGMGDVGVGNGGVSVRKSGSGKNWGGDPSDGGGVRDVGRVGKDGSSVVAQERSVMGNSSVSQDGCVVSSENWSMVSSQKGSGVESSSVGGGHEGSGGEHESNHFR